MVQSLSLETDPIVAGRDASCDLQLEDQSISRRHCEIRLQAGHATVTDLNSRNGIRLGGSQLPPGEAIPWSPGVSLDVGPFELQLIVKAPAETLQPAANARRIACVQATPPAVTLLDTPITIGRDKTCTMVLADRRVSRRACQVWQQGDQVWVSDLGGHGSTRVGKETLSKSIPNPWPQGIVLHVGPFGLIQTMDVADASAIPESATSQTNQVVEPHPSRPPRSGFGRRMWQEWILQLPWFYISVIVGGVCLLLGLGAAVLQVFVFKPDPAPTTSLALSPSPAIAQATETLLPSVTPIATPTPTGTPVGTRSTGFRFEVPTDAPLPTIPCTPQTAGWLDLPFPYDGRNEQFGDAELFRKASQRAAAGGRITSFFDHQYPLYRTSEERVGGAEVLDTLVLFDGSRSLNKITYPDQVGDYYSGHPGFDYSTYEWRKPTTPILAPAGGTFLGAGTDRYGNNFVLLVHDQGEEGTYRTSYLHLHDDAHFTRMLNLDTGTPIKAGERIGTMGNTGNSTGHHLHFEIRRDCNGDGEYSLNEAVDPYGFIPSAEFPSDPLADLACGGTTYLWKYTLDPADEVEGGCAEPERRWQLDPAPFHGFVSLFTLFWTTADPNTLKPRRIPLGAADLEKVEFDSISVHRFEDANWVAVPSELDFADRQTYVVAELSKPGRYTVTGKPKEDIIPPTTSIELRGKQQDGAFVGKITIVLEGHDEGEGVNQIQYSLDCGQDWQTYPDRPLELTPDELAVCSRYESNEENEKGPEPDTFMVLAAAVDWNNNWEQPPSQRQFKLVAAGDSD